MEKYIEVMERLAELTGTIVDGLKHIQKLLGESKFEETMNLLENVVSAFASIEKSIVPVKGKLEKHDIDSKSKNVQEALNLVVSAYELGNYGKAQEILQFTLVPLANKWKEELEKAFYPYIVS